jgi:hypothetical protein
MKHSARNIARTAVPSGNAARPHELIIVIDMDGHLEVVFFVFARDMG